MMIFSLRLLLPLFLGFQSTLEVDVNLVNVSVSVQDSRGGHLDGLAQEDFRLFEDDIERPIEIFERSEDLPSSLGILIDNSGSSAGALASIKAGVMRFAESLGPEDEAFVMSFGIEPRVIHDFRRDVRDLPGALDELRSWGTSVFYDAIYSGIREAVDGKNDRKALIVLSDGNDNRSATSYREVVGAAQSSTVILYFIAMGSPILVDTHTLGGLASMTGGRVVLLRSDQSPADALEEIRQDLARQYYLGYHASSNSGYHSIRVEVPGRDASVRTRAGYLVTPR